MLSPVKKARRDGYNDVRMWNLARGSWSSERTSPLSKGLSKYCGPGFNADLDQDPLEYPRADAQILPCLLRHGDHYFFNLGRSLTSSEHLLSLLAPVFPDVHGGVQIECPFPQALQWLSNYQQKSLAGNGMHIPTMQEFFWYSMASIRRRDCIARDVARVFKRGLHPSASAIVIADEAEDDDL